MADPTPQDSYNVNTDAQTPPQEQQLPENPLNTGNGTPQPAEAAPAPETPVAEAPATETPVAEAPATETPVAEAPTTETPVAEAPAPETPVAETPAPETPVVEAPATEAPVAETPAPEAPVAAPISEATPQETSEDLDKKLEDQLDKTTAQEPTDQEPTDNKKKYLYIALAVVILVAGGYIVYKLFFSNTNTETPEPPAEYNALTPSEAPEDLQELEDVVNDLEEAYAPSDIEISDEAILEETTPEKITR